MKSFTLLPTLSIFFPAYNEAAHIEEAITKALKIAPQVSEKFEILVIDDGSKDRTGDIVSKISKSHPQVKLITHNPNKGYGEALKTGFYNSKYDWVAFTDADGQFDINELPSFIAAQHQTQADLVIGYYRKRAVSWRRKLNTKIWQQLVWLMFGLNVRDIDCGFKLINRRVTDTLPRLESGRGAFISSEFLIKARKAGFKIVEIPVTHYPRVAGKGTGADLNVIINSFLDLFKLWWKLK